jgi:hypothetical protein
MKYILQWTLVVLFSAPVGWPQTSSSQISASKEDIVKLFEVMHLRDQMKLVMNQISAQMKSISHEQLRKRNPQITEEEIANLDAQSDELIKGMPIDGMLDDMLPVYQKHLSKSDVDAMVEFYASPTGQKVLREMPAMTAEGMQAIQPRLRKEMDDAMAKIEDMAKQENSTSAPVKH